ncbi:phage portal protein [Psychromicrobium sp. YIM B11713]|uniref:phage portal protein n=1 Tax=Psychromicrobium sp. YIM B11713 TaxID=3145233 RepID=UPI00374F0E0C
MGIFAKRQKAVEHKSAPAYSSPWQSPLEELIVSNLLGFSSDDAPLTRAEAIQLDAVNRGVQVIKSTITALPLQALDVAGHPLVTQPSLLRQLSQGYSNFQTIGYIVDSLIFYGYCFLRVDSRDFTGYPTFITWIPRNEETTKDGWLTHAFGQPVAPHDVIFIDGLTQGILTEGRQVLNRARNLEKVIAEFSSNPTPHTILKNISGNELDKEEILQVLSDYRQARRQDGITYLNSNFEIDFPGRDTDALLIAGKNQMAVSIARLLNLSAHLVDATLTGQSLNYQNAASRNSDQIGAVQPFMNAITSALSLYLPNGQTVSFNTADLLKPDQATRFSNYETALRAGFMTTNEIRVLEGLPELQEPLTPAQNPPAAEEVAK